MGLTHNRSLPNLGTKFLDPVIGLFDFFEKHHFLTPKSKGSNWR
jgi:hypothetical protein